MLSKYFKEEYQFALQEATYNIIDNPSNSDERSLKVSDDLIVNIVGKQLHAEYCRNVYFEPESLFRLKVIFNVYLYFKDEVNPDSIDVDWHKELTEQDCAYTNNILSRASNIIANLTSAFGQQPLITPPIFQ